MIENKSVKNQDMQEASAITSKVPLRIETLPSSKFHSESTFSVGRDDEFDASE